MQSLCWLYRINLHEITNNKANGKKKDLTPLFFSHIKVIGVINIRLEHVVLTVD